MVETQRCASLFEFQAPDKGPCRRRDLAVPLGWKLVLAPALSSTDCDCDNLSLYAANPTHRENEILEASVSLSRPVTERLSAFLDVTYTDNDSNIPVFEYDRTRVYLGVTCRF